MLNKKFLNHKRGIHLVNSKSSILNAEDKSSSVIQVVLIIVQ